MESFQSDEGAAQRFGDGCDEETYWFDPVQRKSFSELYGSLPRRDLLTLTEKLSEHHCVPLEGAIRKLENRTHPESINSFARVAFKIFLFVTFLVLALLFLPSNTQPPTTIDSNSRRVERAESVPSDSYRESKLSRAIEENERRLNDKEVVRLYLALIYALQHNNL